MYTKLGGSENMLMKKGDAKNGKGKQKARKEYWNVSITPYYTK